MIYKLSKLIERINTPERIYDSYLKSKELEKNLEQTQFYQNIIIIKFIYNKIVYNLIFRTYTRKIINL